MASLALNRRQLLQMFGLGAAAATGSSMLRPRFAHADGSIPKRLVLIYLQSGSMPGRWEPVARPGMAQPTLTEWDVNPDLHGALAAYRADLNYFENLDMVSSLSDPIAASNAHYNGSTHALSATNRAAPNQAGGVSIDQLIAQRINMPRPVTALPSLEINCDESNAEHIVSVPMAGAVLPRLADPAEIYDRLFPGTVDPDARAAARELRMQEFLRARFGATASRLGREDRAKVEQHAQTLADLHARLGLRGSRAANRPPRSLVDPARGLDWRWDAPDAPRAERYRTVCDLNVRLAVAALHTDTTRVVSLDFADAPNGEIGYTAGRWDTSDAHDLIHKVMDPNHALSRNAEAVDTIRRQFLNSMRYVRLLLDELASRTETDGRRLLDHTLVVFTSQIADGSHSVQRLPWFTVGRCGDAIRTGLYVRQSRASGPMGSTVGRAHNDLFVSVANAMDVPITSFGNAAISRGRINELHP